MFKRNSFRGESVSCKRKQYQKGRKEIFFVCSHMFLSKPRIILRFVGVRYKLNFQYSLCRRAMGVFCANFHFVTSFLTTNLRFSCLMGHQSIRVLEEYLINAWIQCPSFYAAIFVTKAKHSAQL